MSKVERRGVFPCLLVGRGVRGGKMTPVLGHGAFGSSDSLCPSHVGLLHARFLLFPHSDHIG